MHLRESKGTAMAKLATAKLLGCRICMVDFARIELADGSFALLCSACDVIGVEHEIAHGGPLWAGETQLEQRPASAARR
jgi:hypothetical protein